jgi:hypothetical protein
VKEIVLFYAILSLVVLRFWEPLLLDYLYSHIVIFVVSVTYHLLAYIKGLIIGDLLLQVRERFQPLDLCTTNSETNLVANAAKLVLCYRMLRGLAQERSQTVAYFY